jgi:hypothetical protein
MMMAICLDDNDDANDGGSLDEKQKMKRNKKKASNLQHDRGVQLLDRIFNLLEKDDNSDDYTINNNNNNNNKKKKNTIHRRSMWGGFQGISPI